VKATVAMTNKNQLAVGAWQHHCHATSLWQHAVQMEMAAKQKRKVNNQLGVVVMTKVAVVVVAWWQHCHAISSWQHNGSGCKKTINQRWQWQ